MTNSLMLRKWIDDKGLKLKGVAAKLDITPYALQRKIDNRSEFKASEIVTFVADLGMTPDERDHIFFEAV